MKKLFFYLTLIWSQTLMATNTNYTIGYLPNVIPRDPIYIDLFLEHIAIGQVIETLVKIDTDGELVPNIASTWKIEDSGRIFKFEIKNDITFSSGKLLTCNDIKFSIERHRNDAKSQSSNYLKNIKKIDCVSDHTIVFTLDKPQVSFLKILTRDHLGILPANWNFNESSPEPWIGTGPYRFIKKDGKSYFIKNNSYRSANTIKIESWEIMFNSDIKDPLKVPDLLLHTPKEKVAEYIKDNKGFNTLSFIKPMHFIQTSIWWHPKGANYKSNNLKQSVMGIFDDFVLSLEKSHQVDLSTGIVPNGVQGHIPKRLKIPYKRIKNNNLKEIVVAVYPNEFNLVSNSKELNNKASLLGIKFRFIKVDYENKNFISNAKPDVVIASYAGGFNDPDGFLIVLGNILEIDPYEFLGPMKNRYSEASKDHDWTNRGKTFREINEYLIRNQLLVPGWKKDILIGKSTRLIENSAFYEYSLRLGAFSPKKE